MERSLHVINKGPDAPLTGVCTACNRRFIARQEPGKDPVHRLTQDFNEHNCEEDASQAAARIAKEASEG